MRWLYFLLLTLRRFVSWRSGDAFIEWKLGILVLWLEVSIVGTLVFTFEGAWFGISPGAVLLATVVPLVMLNQFVLLPDHWPQKHSEAFAALPRLHRMALNLAAAALVALAVMLPFMARTLQTGKAWWQ